MTRRGWSLALVLVLLSLASPGFAQITRVVPSQTVLTGPVQLSDGTASAPSLTFTTDLAQGLYLDTTNDLIGSTGLSVLGRVMITALATPGSITVTPRGTAGATTYTYKLVALSGAGVTAAGAASSTTTGNATLSATNYNELTWAQVPGATGYRIYRTVGGATQGLISTIAAGATLTVNDTGLAGGGETAPTADTTGQLLLPDGVVTAPAFSFASATTDGLIRVTGGNTGIDVVTAGSSRLRLNHYVGVSRGVIMASAGFYAFSAASSFTQNTNDTPDLFLYRDAANILALRNNTNAQQFNLYNTYTDASNYERLELSWNVASNVAGIRAAAAGTGTVRTLRVYYSGTAISALVIPTSAAGVIAAATSSSGTTANVVRMSVADAAASTATSGVTESLRIGPSFSPTATSTMVSIPLHIVPIINYSAGTPGAGSYEALKIAVTETALPTGQSYLLRASAGVAGTTDMFVVTNSGSVGIGTAGPNAKLDVAGTARVADPSTPTTYYVDRTHVGDTWTLGASEATDNIDFKIAGGGTFTTGGNFRFWTQLGGATPIERLRITSSGNVTLAGVITSYNAIATEGHGLVAVRKKPAILTGQTTTVASVGAITTPNDAADHEYLVTGFVNVTAYSSGTINLQVAYTDHGGVAQTKNITLAGDAGTVAGGASSGGYWQGLAIYISADPNTAVTVKTAGTFSATYDVGATITQVN